MVKAGGEVERGKREEMGDIWNSVNSKEKEESTRQNGLDQQAPEILQASEAVLLK